ncbi:hypothetical protein FRB95_001988 [Tulasnella sp. JGI-2019a]|nr:hypothetical protein FRB95_001988 [Tulasnella sp. JGI-2019a]
MNSTSLIRTALRLRFFKPSSSPVPSFTMIGHDCVAVDDLEDTRFDASNVQIHGAGFHKKRAIEDPLHERTNDSDLNLGLHSIGEFEDDSPYPEVRSAVANTDDINMPVGTLRAWIIGLMWAILIPGLNHYCPSRSAVP